MTSDKQAPRNVTHSIDRDYEVDTGMDPDVLEKLLEWSDKSKRGTVLPNPPLWVIGSPRSGSTWFGRVLHSHPGIFLTEESRVMSFLNRVVNRLALDRWILQYGQLAMIRRLGIELPALVEQFYVDIGAKPHQRWGDKHPHYADAQHDPECLDLIYTLFPDSQFIHLVRDGRDVAASFRDKGWGNLAYSSHVWVKHVEHARWFSQRLDPQSWLEIRYEDLMANQEEMFRSVFDFLGLEVGDATKKFLETQGREAWSAPATSDSWQGNSTWSGRFTAEEIKIVTDIQRDTLLLFGYPV